MAATIFLTNSHPLFTGTPALLLLTLGLLLIYLELNRPGSILPGALGLTLTLIALPSLFSQGLHPLAFALLLAAVLTLATGLRRRTHPVISAAAIVALIVALNLIPGVSPLAATLSGLLLGAGTSVLTAIAHRARANKGLDLP